MCQLSGKLSDKKVGYVGYKVLAFKDGKFYSTFTSQEISVGAVPFSPAIYQTLSDLWNSYYKNYNFRFAGFYNKDFDGKTSAFIFKYNATELKKRVKNHLKYTYKDYKIVVVKITFSGDVYEGSYNESQIIAGSQIKSMQICK